MKEIINVEKLNSYGYKLPANNPNYVVPDNITHAQLRYNDFSNTYKVQGSAIAGSPSTFEFDLLRLPTTILGKTHTRYKLYLSNDGINYYEEKSYGGTYGKSLFEEGILIAKYSFTNPLSDNPIAVIINSVYYENEHITATMGRQDEGLYYIVFSQNIVKGGQSNVIVDSVIGLQDSGGIIGYCLNDTSFATASKIYFQTIDSNGNTADNIITNLTIRMLILQD